jgi:hypothetical protein
MPRRRPLRGRGPLLVTLALLATAVALPALPAVARPRAPAAVRRGHHPRRPPRAPAAAACRRHRDVIVPLKYPDAGQVWIPREVVCGGRADVIILLHGNQGSRDPAPSVGGGRHLERLARSLIGAGAVRPVVLAEPVHYSVCNGGRDLFGSGFSFKEYRKRLFRLLGSYAIRPRTMAVVGHSGSGCCTNAGVFKAAEQLRPLRLLATSDTCYHSQSYSKRLREVLRRGTVYLNISRGEPAYERYRTFETEMLGKRPRAVRPCRKSLYRRCLKSPRRPWYSYTTRRTDGGYHDSIPYLVLRTALLRFYGGRKGHKAAPQDEHPPAPPPDFVGPTMPPD